MKIVVYEIKQGDLRLSQASRERLVGEAKQVNAQVVFPSNHEEAVQEVGDADVVFGYITPTMLSHAQQLKWVQAPMSSLGTPRGDYYVFPELAESEVILTNMSGIYGDVISTHVFAFITSFARDFPTLMRNQLRKAWDRNITTTNLHGMTLGVIGLGGIGTSVAKIGAAFGMRIIAVDPNPQTFPSCVEIVWPPKDLMKLMREADFVVLCLPDAPGTVNIVGAEEISAMKKTAYLINIGRGRTVDLDALTTALTKRAIAGAGLDVFPPEFEPLPSNHPLWNLENVIITPHCAGSSTPSDRRVTVFLENLSRFTKNETLLNIVDKHRMVRVGVGYDILESRSD